MTPSGGSWRYDMRSTDTLHGRMRARQGAAVAALLGGAATVVAAIVARGRPGYHNVALGVAVDTALAVFGVLAAAMVWARFRRNRRLYDLLLAYALTVLGLSTLVFRAIPATFVSSRSDFVSWAPIVARALGALLLAATAVVPTRRVDGPVSLRAAAVVVLAPLAVIAAVMAALAPHLPNALDTGATATPGHHPFITGIQCFVVLLFAITAVGFVRESERNDDEFAGWLGAGSVVAAFAWLNYALSPSLNADWFYIGDGFRLVAYGLFLVGAFREFGAYWDAMTRVAAEDERQRVARDLHDGIAQELAYIVGQTRSLAKRVDDPDVPHIARAAERALDESRRAITALRSSGEETVSDALTQAAEDVAHRVGVAVQLSLDPGVTLDAAAKEEVLRIVREAVTNAARHGKAQRVGIVLIAMDGQSLTIRDDGTGFDPAVTNGGFGLVSMRERAKAIGAEFLITSALGKGTTVTVKWR
jgi:signal transduction histidine kinase